MNSIINADQHFLVLAMVTGAAAFGIWSEHKKWFGKVLGILVTMISMSLLAMLGVVPVGSGTGVSVPVYDMVFDYFIPISIPLLLLSSNIVKIITVGFSGFRDEGCPYFQVFYSSEKWADKV